MDKSLVSKATSPEEDPTPGYMYNEISRITHVSADACKHLEEFLLKRLKKDNVHQKLKVLRVIKHCCKQGHATFRRDMQRQIGEVKPCLGGIIHPLSPLSAAPASAQLPPQRVHLPASAPPNERTSNLMSSRIFVFVCSLSRSRRSDARRCAEQSCQGHGTGTPRPAQPYPWICGELDRSLHGRRWSTLFSTQLRRAISCTARVACKGLAARGGAALAVNTVTIEAISGMPQRSQLLLCQKWKRVRTAPAVCRDLETPSSRPRLKNRASWVRSLPAWPLGSRMACRRFPLFVTRRPTAVTPTKAHT